MKVIKYIEKLEKELDQQECPHCKSKEIGIDNWGMFEGERDWFYYCKKCDTNFKENKRY